MDGLPDACTLRCDTCWSAGASGAMPESEVHHVCRYSRCDKTGPRTMSWATAFRLRQFALGSLWVLPLAGGLLGVLLGSGSKIGRAHV